MLWGLHELIHLNSAVHCLLHSEPLIIIRFNIKIGNLCALTGAQLQEVFLEWNSCLNPVLPGPQLCGTRPPRGDTVTAAHPAPPPRTLRRPDTRGCTRPSAGRCRVRPAQRREGRHRREAQDPVGCSAALPAPPSFQSAPSPLPPASASEPEPEPEWRRRRQRSLGAGSSHSSLARGGGGGDSGWRAGARGWAGNRADDGAAAVAAAAYAGAHGGPPGRD